MLKYLVILTMFASGFHALIPDYAENDTLSNDINDLQDNNPLVAVYGNLIETLKYPKDVELNEYITFSTNNPQRVDAQSKNNENAGVEIGNFTTTEAPVYRPTKMEVEFNSLTWEERWQRIWESLGGFLESHDVDLVVPYYESAMVRVSLRDYMNNGSAIDFKIYPEGKTAVDGGDKGPKEEVESLKRLKDFIFNILSIISQISVVISAFFASIVLRVFYLPTFLPFYGVIRTFRIFFFG